ncbi:rna polymerase iii transcription initiation factor complex subunit [Holotrichia oblita]|uniref:Rna polymerase iii transcription initiation factor complex subunit n=1 Tax=Holotrichia oblita TaxID=644536 RepID=A0ACB9TFT9_HOLOL|nr:rna polymerase iii transcription initiation factor complex subunit [Holotrichia oblita]
MFMIVILTCSNKKIMDKSPTTSNLSDSEETQTIVITPAELKKMSISNEIKSAIEAQTKKIESKPVALTKPVDDTKALTIDPNLMRNKLCTLLNHTPLVMQVKEVDWMQPDKKTPIILNSAVSSAPVSVSPSVSPTPTNSQVITLEDDAEETPKLKIVSDEKSNISPSEIESMLSSGKTVKSDDKISAAPQKQCLLDIKDKEDGEQIRIELNDPETIFDDTSTVTSQSSSTVTATTPKIYSTAAVAKANTSVTQPVTSNEASKSTTDDAGIIKKECLKRIQAKMYENLKKVLEEVESRPIKDRASFDIKPVPTTVEEALTVTKPIVTTKSIEKSVRENKPCYMNKYRERKLSQEALESTKSSKSTTSDVIEIDSKPGSPVAVINIEDDDGTEKTNTAGLRERPSTESTSQNQNEQGATFRKEEHQTSPLKKSIVKRFSEFANKTAVIPEKNPIPTEQEKIPRKRGRPRKNEVRKVEDLTTNEETKIENGKEVQREEEESVDQSAHTEETELPADKPTPKRRGRPPKKRPAESTETHESAIIQEGEISTQELESSKEPDEDKIEYKTPKKRGRKSKAELEAMRKESAQKVEEKPVSLEPDMYAKSKISGRKRKVIDYSLLNGEDSDADEEEVQVRKVEIQYKRLSRGGNSKLEETVKSSKDEYGSSASDESKTERNDISKTYTSRKKFKQADEPIEEETKLEDDDVKIVETQDIGEVQEIEREPNADQVKCGVCKAIVEKISWSEHKRKVHNDLAWNSTEEPLNLEDTTVVEEILNIVLKEVGMLKCLNCENKSDTVEDYVQHRYDCNSTTNLNTSVGTNKRRTKKRKPGGAADVLDSLFMQFTSLEGQREEQSEVDNTPTPEINVAQLGKDQTQCAICMSVMPKINWFLHKQNSHNNLAWRIGDPPLDLSNQGLVLKILTELLHKKKPLRCESCGNIRKSVMGFLSHRSQCRKSANEIEDLKVKCHLCDRRMLPVSLSRHIVLSHEKEPTEKADLGNDAIDEVCEPGSKRKAAHKAAEIIQSYNEDSPEKTKKYIRGVRFRSNDEVISKFNEDIQNSGVASCLFENCNYTASDAEDLFQHLENCMEKCVAGYTCNYCLATFQQRNSVRSHILMAHSNQNKHNLIMQNASSDEEKFEDSGESEVESIEGSPYQKIEKICYTKFHAKFLGQLIKKSVHKCYFNAYKWTLNYINDDGSTTIFCGGPISAMSWAPTPHYLEAENQILAVSVLPDPDKEYLLIDNYREKGLIQFWNYGVLHNKTILTTAPKLEFCIAHNYGVIWCMEWCPSGCYDSTEVEDSLKKLGLLAVACSDSQVYIYTVLRPQQIPGKIFDVVPTFKLSMQSTDTNLGEIPFHAIRISWTKAAGHSYIAVGYSNGVISIFNINTESVLLKTNINGVNVLHPIITFKAHNASVTALVLYHLDDGKRWLISGSLDRDVKLWDLKNISEPISTLKKAIVTDAIWSMHWHNAIYSFNQSIYINCVPTNLIPARNFNGLVSPFLPSVSATMSISFSEWANLLVQANESGEVICSFPDQLLYAFEKDKRKALRKSRFLASYSACIPKNLSIEERQKKEAAKLHIAKQITSTDKMNSTEPSTYQEASDYYGLVLCDFKMNKTIYQPWQQMQQLVRTTPFHSISKPDMYPLQSINKIVLNPNRYSYLHYACGYQVGLVRTSVLTFLNSDS